MPEKVQTPPTPSPDAPAHADGAAETSVMPDEVPVPKQPDAVDGQAAKQAAVHKPMPFVFDPFGPYKGAVRRFFIAYRHVVGLLMGGAVAYARALPPEKRRWFRSPGPRLMGVLLKPFVKRSLVNEPFPVQLRRRLEILGPTFIKLGQIMAIREDLLPTQVTDELKNLFDRLPAIPFETIREIVEQSLGLPLDDLFDAFAEEPIGSASIAQAHIARTKDGDAVVVKVMKPGIRQTVVADLKLLEAVGHVLQRIIPRYQPRQIVEEFSAYTLREVDFTYEADNGEIFAANFRDVPGVVFPTMYRALSSEDVLTMEFFDGFSPSSDRAQALSEAERQRIIDLGAASIIRMLYQDGFFHADLHAGNLMILPDGDSFKVGFIDLGMVGRFEEKTKRRMLYYYQALVNGDVEGAAKYLTAMAHVGEGGDPKGFRRAVADTSRRFILHGTQGDISVAQLILESVGLGGKYRVFFPVEMTLMVKALVTYEGVGRLLDPKIDVAAVSRKHVARVFRRHFDPDALLRKLMGNAPEMLDLVVQSPQLLASGFRFLEESLNDRSPQNPLAGLRSSIIAGSCIVGGVLTLIQGGPIVLWIGLFALGFLLSVFGK